MRPGSFRSAEELIAMIATFTAQWNEGATLFVIGAPGGIRPHFTNHRD
jgi:hypothetical protein